MSLSSIYPDDATLDECRIIDTEYEDRYREIRQDLAVKPQASNDNSMKTFVVRHVFIGGRVLVSTQANWAIGQIVQTGIDCGQVVAYIDSPKLI